MAASKVRRGKAEAAGRMVPAVDPLPRRSKGRTPSRTAFRRAPLASLRVFVAVADHKSFTRGAHALGITTSAASMQVQALEEYLRVSVLRRNGRLVELTQVGARLRPKVEQALADLERAIDEARADRGSGPLRVTTLAFFLAQWLLPRLSTFTAQHASIDVQIHTAVGLTDFVRTGMDAGIRLGGGGWPSLHSQKLFDEWLVPVCTPALLRRHGPVAEASDLKRWIRPVVVDELLAIAGRRLMRSHAQCKKPSDGVHLATACALNVDEMHTFDKSDLLSLDGKVMKRDGKPLKICLPYAMPPPTIGQTDFIGGVDP